MTAALPDGISLRPFPVDRDLQYLPTDARGKRIAPEQCAAFSITYTLRDTVTGAEHVITDDWNPHAIGDEESTIHSIEFQYTQGNYACDCNRARFWQRAEGVPEVFLDMKDVYCTNNPRYHIVAPAWLAAADEENNR